MADGGLKFSITPRRTTIVYRENGEAVLSHNLMKESFIMRTGPLIAHNLRPRPTIDIDDQRNLSTRLPSWREKQLAVEFRAIFSLKFKSLGSVQAKIIYISRIPERATRPACVACRQPRRCKHGREIVNVPLAVVRKRRFMCAVFARNSLQFRTVDLRRVKLPLSRIIFVTGEVNDSAGLINAVDPKHFEITLRELALELGIGRERPLFIEAVEIKMRVPVTPAWP